MAATYKIEFPRGDSYHKGFILKQGDVQIGDQPDEVYFTVKNNYEERSYLFQKKLSTGGITFDNGHYVLYIDPQDTDGRKYGDYVFDFEFIFDGKKSTFCGKLKLTNEVTFVTNE